MKQEPRLVIDIGNTSVSAGRFARGRVNGIRRVATREIRRERLAAWLKEVAGDRPVRQVVLASVVPRAVPAWRRAIASLGWPRPVEVSHRIPLGIGIDYPRPESIGADRLADAVGAVRRHGAPVLVVDFGTAVTFDVILPRRGYAGGVIAPGLPLMFDYLAERTALLPRLSPEEVDEPFGRSTETAMRLGAQIGYAGMVEGIVRHLRRELRRPRMPLVATGGFARWVLGRTRLKFSLEPDLTLAGLGWIGELNEHDDRRADAD